MLDLDYTGHPFFDVGLATIVAHAGREHPTELIENDLHKAADFIKRNYTKQPLTSFLTTSLMNSDFTQPAFEKKLERRIEYAERVARSFGEDAPKSEEVCVFTGKPALGVALSLKRDKDGREELPPGRAYRQHIPLITSENIINFSPWGDPGLPISGEALLCLQFFPMGCRKCAGRLLAIHSDNPEILLSAAHEALDKNIAAIMLAQTSGDTKLQDASPSAPSLLIETIVSLSKKQADIRRRKKDQSYSITAYHLTNSGQSSALDEKSPPLKIYHLPMSIIRFLQRATTNPDYETTWCKLVARGRVLPKSVKGKQASKNPEEIAKSPRNYFYEDILRLPQEADRFIRRYFLHVPDLHSAQRGTASTSNDEKPQSAISIIPWSFIDLFLQEVIHMEKKRIAAIKELGDRLANYVNEFDDRRFFNKFYEVQRSDFFRNELLRAAKKATSHGKTPLFTYDSFCTVFFTPDGDDEMLFDWKLARDLTFIRMLEWLSENDSKLSDHIAALPEDRDLDSPSLEDEQ